MRLLPRRRIWRMAIYLFSSLLVVIAADLILVETRRTIHPGFDTTRLVAPLQPDGSVDYLLAIDNQFSEGVTPQNNAAVLVLQALGRSALASNQPPDGITDSLGMPHLPEKGDYFVAYDEYCRQHSLKEESEPLELSQTTQPVDIKPATQEWVKLNEKPLTLLVEASRRSRFFIPFYAGTRPTMLAEVLLPYLAGLRSANRALVMRSLMRLQKRDVAGFRDDVMAAHRLARLVGQESTMVGRMVGAAIESLACRAERIAAASGKLSADQLRELAGELSVMKDPLPMADCLNIAERLMVLDLLQTAARAGPVRAWELINTVLTVSQPSGAKTFEPALYRFMPVPYEECMRVVNRFYDGALSITQLPTYAQRMKAMDLWNQQFIRLGERSTVSMMFSADWWPARVLLPWYVMMKPLQRADIVRMENRLTQIALVLAAFKADHQAYPTTLGELAPEYLRTMPIDHFSDRPLLYARTGQGYTLYSVGPNMIDDGGQTATPADDIVASVP